MKVLIVFLVACLASTAHAVIRPIIVPGTMATIMLQAVSAAGGGQIDPEPRDLYDAIALPEQAGPGGGKGKVIGTAAKDFNLNCAFKSMVTPLNVVCTIIVKPSARSQLGANFVEFIAEGADAEALYEKFAGSQPTKPFVWESKNGWVRIESQPSHFSFRFKR